MSRITRYPIDVLFGDCDPAGIVYFPNFLRWMDAGSLDFFRTAGLPRWAELTADTGIIGTPVLQILDVRFQAPATYGERLQVETRISEWRGKLFVQQHRILRADEVLCEGEILRAFVARAEGDTVRMRVVPAPDWIRAACDGD